MVKRRAERERRDDGEAAHTKPERELRLVGTLLQPTSQHYNGQGMVRPSTCIALHADDFESKWRELWSLHVNFGTSKSHKKLAKKAEKRAMAETAARYSSSAHPTAAAAPKAAGAAADREPRAPAARPAASTVSDLAHQQRRRAIMSGKAAMLLAGAPPSAS